MKRLLREAAELSEPSDELHAQPLEDNLFEWHFTIRGAPETEFAAGVYHGRILLPPEYPMKPPSIILLTVMSRLIICIFLTRSVVANWHSVREKTPNFVPKNSQMVALMSAPRFVSLFHRIILRLGVPLGPFVQLSWPSSPS